jgi:hypothetical protein
LRVKGTLEMREDCHRALKQLRLNGEKNGYEGVKQMLSVVNVQEGSFGIAKTLEGSIRNALARVFI